MRSRIPKVLILNGPNLNLLGTREPHLYGSLSLNDINQALDEKAKTLGIELHHFQSNHEGVMIDEIQKVIPTYQGIIINAGGLSHTSIALADALRAFKGVIIEVHLSNIHARESFRHHSHISSIAKGVIVGLGAIGYEFALISMHELLKD